MLYALRSCVSFWFILSLHLTSIYGSTYYVSNSPSADYQCPSDITPCHIYCDQSNVASNNVYHCNNADNCYFHCDALKCGLNAVITGANANILTISQAINGQECLTSANITAPNSGSAYFSTYSQTGFQYMKVYAGSNTHEIIIDTTSGQNLNPDKEYLGIEVHAATADYLRINVGTNLQWISATIECPVDSSYNGPDMAPCMIDATGGKMKDSIIIAPDGTPKNVYIEGCSQCNNVELQCANVDTLNGAESGTSIYPFSTASHCWWTPDPTASPTNDPTFDPTLVPTHPTYDPTNDPTFNPTIDPTYDPTIEPTNDPTYDPTIDPTYDPTNDPTFDPTQHPTMPTYQPTEDPTQAPSWSPTSAPTQPPSLPPSVAPSTSPTSSPTQPPSNAPSIAPTDAPTGVTQSPSNAPTIPPTFAPVSAPSSSPTNPPTFSPTLNPSLTPSYSPTAAPTTLPTNAPSSIPTVPPTMAPTLPPSRAPSTTPTSAPTNAPTTPPTHAPSTDPTTHPSVSPTFTPSAAPTRFPTTSPSNAPSNPSQPPTNEPSQSPTFPTIHPTTDPTLEPTFLPSQTPLFSTEIPINPSTITSLGPIGQTILTILIALVVTLVFVLICVLLLLWIKKNRRKLFRKAESDNTVAVVHLSSYSEKEIEKNEVAPTDKPFTNVLKEMQKKQLANEKRDPEPQLARLETNEYNYFNEDEEHQMEQKIANVLEAMQKEEKMGVEKRDSESSLSRLKTHEYNYFKEDSKKRDSESSLSRLKTHEYNYFKQDSVQVKNDLPFLEEDHRESIVNESDSASEDLWDSPEIVETTAGPVGEIKVNSVVVVVSGVGEGVTEVDKLREWMDNVVNLHEYTDRLIRNGYNDMESLKGLSHEGLMKMGVLKWAHRRKILKFAKALTEK